MAAIDKDTEDTSYLESLGCVALPRGARAQGDGEGPCPPRMYGPVLRALLTRAGGAMPRITPRQIHAGAEARHDVPGCA